MITEVKIERLRGIREGHLTGLTPLTILTGANGAGKSTVLEALLLGAAPGPSQALAEVVRRHSGVRQGAPWLLWKKGSEGAGRVEVHTDGGESRHSEVTFDPGNEGRQLLQLRFLPGPEPLYWAEFSPGDGYSLSHRPSGSQVSVLDGVADVRLIEAHDPAPREPLDDVYSRAVEQGRLDPAQEILGRVVPGLQDLRILKEPGGGSVLQLRFADRSVPAALCGDGIHALTRLCLELATAPKGVLLLEEPEVHQHPASLRQTALAVVSAVERGVQVVLTTHSLELIDCLLDAMKDHPGRVSVVCMRLDQGTLVHSRFTGEEAELARFQVESDLR